MAPNETLVIIDTIVRIIINVVIICAFGAAIYYRKRILEALEEIRRRHGQLSHGEEGVAFVDRHDGDVDREVR